MPISWCPFFQDFYSYFFMSSIFQDFYADFSMSSFFSRRLCWFLNRIICADAIRKQGKSGSEQFPVLRAGPVPRRKRCVCVSMCVTFWLDTRDMKVATWHTWHESCWWT
jgi:hypothetical protein